MKNPVDTTFRDLKVEITELELAHENTRRYVVRKIANAIETEATRPFREVLSMGGKAKE